jgi:hypothetical protein
MKTTMTFRFLLCLLALLLAGNADIRGEIRDSNRKKEFEKSFSVGHSDRLHVDNRYGSITVTHWKRNEISIRVVIEAKAKTDSRAKKMIDGVDVQLHKAGNTVSGVTSMKNFNSANNERLNIHYYISMPSRLPSSLVQKYGNINLPERNEGDCRLDVKYGNINAGSFTAGLAVEAQYGNVYIDDVEKADMKLAYCGKTVIRQAGFLDIDSRYSGLKIERVKDLELEARYGNLDLGKADNAHLEMKYSNAEIDLLTNKLIVEELSYGKMTVREVSPHFTRIEANTHYSTLNLRIPSRLSFDVEAEGMRYGNYDISGFDAQTQKDNSGGVSYRSKVNHGDSRRIIRFNGNQHGNLKIEAL